MIQYLNALLVFAWLLWLFIGGCFGWFLCYERIRRQTDSDVWALSERAKYWEKECRTAWARNAKFDVRSKKRDAKTGRFTTRSDTQGSE